MNQVQPLKMSVVLPNFNSSQDLAAALDSLVSQTKPFHEIVVVDDGSTDHSLDIIHAFMTKHDHIKLLQHDKNKGACEALNTGITASTGDFILLAAADDFYPHDLVANALHVAEVYPHVGLICGDAMISSYDLPNSFLRKLPFKPINSFISPAEFIQAMHAGYVGFNGAGGMFMRRDAILDAGKLYPELRWHCDWLLYFAVAMKRGIFYMNKVFVHVNMREASYSQGKFNWQQQQQVMQDTLSVMYNHYPQLWGDFKRAALLPHYSLRNFFVLMTNPLGRKFISPKLFWKSFINNRIIVSISRKFPYRIVLKMRQILKA